MFARFQCDHAEVQPDVVTYSATFTGWIHNFVSALNHLQPDSGGFSKKTHNHVMRKWASLWCALNDRSLLILIAVSMAIVFVARAPDLRVNTTLVTSIGLYREMPLSRYLLMMPVGGRPQTVPFEVRR